MRGLLSITNYLHIYIITRLTLHKIGFE